MHSCITLPLGFLSIVTLMSSTYVVSKSLHGYSPRTGENSSSSVQDSRNDSDFRPSATKSLQRDGRHSRTDISDTFDGVLLFDRFLALEKSKLVLPPVQEEVMLWTSRDEAQEERNCSVDIQSFFGAVRNRFQWALAMLDASGKPGFGTLNKNVSFLGAYDECLDVETGLQFETRFCGANVWISEIQNITFTKPLGFFFGLCVPSSCNGEELETYLNAYLRSHQELTAGASQTHCQDRHIGFTSKDTVAVCICSIFAALLIFGTAYDVIYKQWQDRAKGQPTSRSNGHDKQTTETPDGQTSAYSERVPIHDSGFGKMKLYSQNGTENASRECSHQPVDWKKVATQCLLSFSVYTNASRLLSSRQPPGAITCLSGIRTISMVWIILFHTVMYAVIGLTDDAKGYFEKAHGRLTFMTITNASAAVDTFFAMSGLLVTYHVLKDLRQKQPSLKFFVHFYLHRFWRLTPVYMMVLMIYITLYRFISDGPLWPQDGLQGEECRKSWWTNLLYINNFVKLKDICMGSSWYLSLDMQFYILSPLLFLPIYYYDWRGLFVSVAVLISSIICSGVVSAVEDLPAVKHLEDPKYQGFDNTWATHYTKPHTRIGVYIVGMLTGHLLMSLERPIKLPKMLVLCGWLTATVTALAVVYGPFEDIHGEPLSKSITAFYNAFHWTAWSLSVCWVIFACSNGYGGIVNTFLSWKAFVPLGRLTYCAYLVHPMVQAYFFYSQRKLMAMDNMNMAFLATASVALSFPVAFLTSLAFEVPMIGLERTIKVQVQKGSRKK